MVRKLTPRIASQSKIGNRDELERELQIAAELEHSLCCQYLFAAFSLRQTIKDFPPRSGQQRRQRQQLEMIRRWSSSIMLIARQEMEHLAIVCNLLNAIDGQLNFNRPNFPQPAKRYPLGVPFLLERLTESALRRFVCFEKPDDVDGFFWDHVASDAREDLKALEMLPSASTRWSSVQELYEQINTAFNTLDPRDIFIGSPQRQVEQSRFAYRITVLPVTNAAEASQAIGLIVEQGEGIGLTPVMPDESHFRLFLNILQEFEVARQSMPRFNPTFPVVDNPALKLHPNAGKGYLVKHHVTREVMKLFNDAYYVMLSMLKSWFEKYTGSQMPPQEAAEFYAAFFPLMTMAIRPLGEMLTRMPADEDENGRTAGPSFELEEGCFDQSKGVDWFVQKLKELEDQALDLTLRVSSGLSSRMKYLSENLHSTRLHFEQISRTPGKSVHFPI